MSQLQLAALLAGSGNVLAGGDNDGNVTKVSIGSNLTLSGGILSATGGGTITGSGTTNYLTKWSSATGITNSILYDNGTNIGIGTLLSNSKLAVQGEIAKYTTTGIDSTFDNLIKFGYYADLNTSGGANVTRWIGLDASVTAGTAVSNVLRVRVYGGGTSNTAPVNVVDFRGDTSSLFYGSITASSIIKSGGTSSQYLMADGSTSTLTNPITGSGVGTTNTIPKYTASYALANSNISDNGTLITLGSNSYVNGALGIGTSTLTGYNLRVSKNITGAISSFGISVDATIQSDVTTSVRMYNSAPVTQAATFTLSSLQHYVAGTTTIGAGSIVTNQYGFLVLSNLTGATTNYGFNGQLAAATGVWNLYMSGTANNYLAGNLGIGTSTLTGYVLRLANNITGATTSYAVRNTGVVQSDVISIAYGFSNTSQTAAASFTLGSYFHYAAYQGTIGASSAITNQYGYYVDPSMSGATNNYGFRSDLTAATGAWNFYAAGTANNYIAGALGIGYNGSALSYINLFIGRNLTGNTGATAIYINPTLQSDVTGSPIGVQNILNTVAAAFTISTYSHFSAQQGTIGAGSALTSQYGFRAESTLTGATNNYGFYGNIASGTNRWNIYMNGTAANYVAGVLNIGTTTLSGYNLDVNGTARFSSTVTGLNFFQSSDTRLKNIISGVQSDDIEAIVYKWKKDEDSKLNWGYAAQSVQKYLPDAVNEDSNGHLSVDYQQVHTWKIAKLEARIKELENRLNANK